MRHIRLSDVENQDDIIKNALTELKKLTGVTDVIREVENTRYYNHGATTNYQLVFENGDVKHVKNTSGTALIDAMSELADVTVYRVSEAGIQDSKLLGWIIQPNFEKTEPETIELSIQEICDIYLHRYVYDGSVRNEAQKSALEKICEDVDEWAGTPAEPLLAKYVLGHEGKDKNGEYIFPQKLEAMSRPMSERKFYELRNNDFNKNPWYTGFDGNGKYYVFVHSEFEGRFGKQFLVALNCENGLWQTYSRKQINETLEVGKFYKIYVKDVVYFGKNRKKFIYNIEEIDEETYLHDGIRNNQFWGVSY